MSSYAEQYIERRARLGMPPTQPRVKRIPLAIPAPTPTYQRRTPRPLVTLPTKPVTSPITGEVWPAQPKPVFYDEAAPQPGTTWQDILDSACKDHDVNLLDLLGPRHFRKFVVARDEAAFRMVTELQMTWAAVGRRLGRDSTSVIAAINRYMRAVPGARAKYRAARAQIKRDHEALKEEARRLYRDEGKSARQIVELLPLSQRSVKVALKEWKDWI